MTGGASRARKVDQVSRVTCTFSLAYTGLCGSVYVGPSGMCAEHDKTLCVACGAKALGQCAHASQFVCGSPLCADCGSATSPQGYHTHARLPGRGRGALNLVFSGEAPDLVFVEAEDKDGTSVAVGRWFREGKLTILALDTLSPLVPTVTK